MKKKNSTGSRADTYYGEAKHPGKRVTGTHEYGMIMKDNGKVFTIKWYSNDGEYKGTTEATPAQLEQYLLKHKALNHYWFYAGKIQPLYMGKNPKRSCR